MPGRDFNDFAAGKTDEELRAHVDGGVEAPHGAPEKKPNGSTGYDGILPHVLYADARPNLSSDRWLIKGIIPRTGLGSIYGPSGGGKTFVTLDQLLCIASGVWWRNHRTKRAGVLYLAPDGGGLVANRIAAWRTHYNVRDADFALAPSPIDLLGKTRPGDVVRVTDLIGHLEAARKLQIAVVCVDTVSRAMPGGDENASQDMSRLIENLALIQNGTDRVAIGVHHTPKSDATVLRGHSSLHGACDFEINVNERVIKIVKQRDGIDGTEFGFDLDVIDLGIDEDGDPVTSCVAMPADGTQPKAKKLTPREKLTLETLENLIAIEGEELPCGTRFPTSGHQFGANLSAFRREFCSRVMSGQKPDTSDREFRRMREKLQSIGLIAVYEDWVWLPDKAGKWRTN